MSVLKAAGGRLLIARPQRCRTLFSRWEVDIVPRWQGARVDRFFIGYASDDTGFALRPADAPDGRGSRTESMDLGEPTCWSVR